MSRRALLARVLVLGVLVVAAVGCGQREDVGAEGSTAAQPTETQQPPTGPTPGDVCKGGATEPATLEELLGGLREAGYNVYVDPNCADDAASWGVTNFSDLVPELRSESFEVTRTREGAIACLLFADVEGSSPTVRTRKWESDEFTTVYVLNVSCYIYPDPGKETEHIATLVKTLNRLAASQNP